MFHFTISFSILHSPDAGKSIACLRARHRPTVTIRLPSSVTFAFQLGWRWRWKDKFSIFAPHRTSLATDYRESNLTLDTWEKVRSKGLSVHWRGSKYSSVVALIRNASAGYWWPGSSDKVAILAEAGHRRHHTTTGKRLSTSTSLIPIQWSPLTHHNDVMPFQIST